MESTSLTQLGIIGILSPKLPIPLKPNKNTTLCHSTSKWADRLISDFQFSPDPTTPTQTTTLSPSLPPPPAQRYVPIPIELYAILGAETHFLSDGIKRAYEAKLSKPPQYGFSQDLLIARRQILQGACDTLCNGSTRIEYNRGLAEDEEATVLTQVPWDKVPGALCVLQEAGETEVVLQIGESLLRERLPKSFKQDIVLVMALAYVDMSRDAMALSPPDFIGGCELLERGLKLLQEEGASSLAPDLQAQIDETLEEITPRCVLELLALPLDAEYRSKREEGLRGVRNILWAVGGGGAAAIAGGFTREKFMNEAFLRMTASEQVDLFVATPSNIPAESFEVYGVALALVAQAFLGKKPHLIKDADNLFQQLQQTRVTNIENAVSVYSPSESREIDFSLERGLCSLLVGELEECRSWLGLDSENSPYRNPSVVNFILDNSQGDDENDLPGLCKLLETWLMEVVFPRFRDTNNIQFKLRDYYDDPKVLRYLESLEGVGSSPLAAAAAIVKIGAEATAVLDTVKVNALQALQRVFPSGHKESDVRENDKSNYSVSFFGNGEPLENSDQEDFSKVDEMSRNRDYGELSDESLITNKIKDSTVKMMCAGVVVGAMALFVLKLVPTRNGATLQKEIGTAVTSDVMSNELTTEDKLEEQPRMDSRYAEEVVRKWQDIKSQALGFNHIVGKLPEVLDGEMLKIWADRAAEVAQRGWYWDFTLLNLAIDNVTLSKDGQRAMVEATLTESARLNGVGSLEHKDSYTRTYTARYVMVCTEMGWKISEGAVLESLDVDGNEVLV